VHWTRGALVDFPGPDTAEAKYGESGLKATHKRKQISSNAKHEEIFQKRKKNK
jgi:hypothetical protein